MSSEPGLAVAGKPLVFSAHSSPLNYCIDGPVGKGMGAASSRSTMGWSVLVLAELQCFSWRNASQFVYGFGWFPECWTHIWVLFDFISCVLGNLLNSFRHCYIFPEGVLISSLWQTPSWALRTSSCMMYFILTSFLLRTAYRDPSSWPKI